MPTGCVIVNQNYIMWANYIFPTLGAQEFISIIALL